MHMFITWSLDRLETSSYHHHHQQHRIITKIFLKWTVETRRQHDFLAIIMHLSDSDTLHCKYSSAYIHNITQHNNPLLQM